MSQLREFVGFLRTSEIRVGKDDLRRISLVRTLLYLTVILGTFIVAIIPGAAVFSVARLIYSTPEGSSVTATQITNFLLSEVATIAAFAMTMWLVAMSVQLVVLWIQQEPGSHPITTCLVNGRKALTRTVTALGIGLPYTMLAYYLSSKALSGQIANVSAAAVPSDSTLLADVSLMMAYLFFSVWILVEAAVAIWWLFQPGHAIGSIFAVVVTTITAASVDHFKLFDKLTLHQATGGFSDEVLELMQRTGIEAAPQILIWLFLALLPLGFIATVGYRYSRFVASSKDKLTQ